jgi:hypothetical protein
MPVGLLLALYVVCSAEAERLLGVHLVVLAAAGMARQLLAADPGLLVLIGSVVVLVEAVLLLVVLSVFLTMSSHPSGWCVWCCHRCTWC